jgi:26S proteasome regulatory subunit N7
MAFTFGVTSVFIDKELSNIIADGRISAKIDKVSGIVECTQEEPTVTMYYKSLKEGDILISKVHKLARFLEVK